MVPPDGLEISALGAAGETWPHSASPKLSYYGVAII